MQNEHTLFIHESGKYRMAECCEIISAAKKVMHARFASGPTLTSSSLAIEFLQIQLGDLEREIFCVLWLNNKHKLICFEKLFAGTISKATIHPREVVKSALKHNAAACILSHNHPSGDSTPSQADIAITEQLTKTLALIDVRVLDHLIVGSDSTSSLADLGLI